MQESDNLAIPFLFFLDINIQEGICRKINPPVNSFGKQEGLLKLMYIFLTHLHDPKTTGNLTHRSCLPESHYFFFKLLISLVIPQNQPVSVRPDSIEEKPSLIKQMQLSPCPARLSNSFHLIFAVWIRPKSFGVLLNLDFFKNLFSKPACQSLLNKRMNFWIQLQLASQ